MGYLGYWALFSKPFARTEGDSFFSAAPQREAMAGLSYVTASRFGAAFLVSPRRCGVSRLMQHVCQMHGLGDCATEVILTSGDQHDCGEVSASLAQALGVRGQALGVRGQEAMGVRGQEKGLRIKTGHEACFGAVDSAIEGCHRDGVKVVWLIDGITTCTLNSARTLLASHGNLSVIMGATPAEHERFRGILGDAVVQIDLDRLSVEEAADYLRWGLADVGCKRDLFQDGSIVRLHELSDGAIADLGQFAELSLAVAARYRMESVTSSIVEAAMEMQAQAA